MRAGIGAKARYAELHEAETTAPNFVKNSPASFFAVESINRPPSCANLPPICESTS